MKRFGVTVLAILFLSSAAHATPMSEWIYILFSGIVDEPGGYFPSSGYIVTGYLRYDPLGGPYDWQARLGAHSSWPPPDACCFKVLDTNAAGFQVHYESGHDRIYVVANFDGTGFFAVRDLSGFVRSAHGTITSVPELVPLLFVGLGLVGVVAVKLKAVPVQWTRTRECHMQLGIAEREMKRSWNSC